MRGINRKLTLYQEATYLITVPGHLDEARFDWGEVTITLDCDVHGQPFTKLTVTVDQAALQGLLRGLYSMGFPLISVIWIDG